MASLFTPLFHHVLFFVCSITPLSHIYLSTRTTRTTRRTKTSRNTHKRWGFVAR
jgi:hypothetical protein